MDPRNPSSGGRGGGSSKGSTPDAKGKGSEILDGLHPRIETRGQSRRHDSKKGDKKKGSKSSQSVPATSNKDDPASASTQADTLTVEEGAAQLQDQHSGVGGNQMAHDPQDIEMPDTPGKSKPPLDENLPMRGPDDTNE